mmetsp:Transcript_16825/g.46391  ORF Transcript_16825/g.46391 Transcript_16825/m.46391 type:complete len:251 (-) Transcript_16825:650-1402(-)
MKAKACRRACRLPSLARVIICSAKGRMALALTLVVFICPWRISSVTKPLMSAFLWSAGLPRRLTLQPCLIMVVLMLPLQGAARGVSHCPLLRGRPESTEELDTTTGRATVATQDTRVLGRLVWADLLPKAEALMLLFINILIPFFNCQATVLQPYKCVESVQQHGFSIIKTHYYYLLVCAVCVLQAPSQDELVPLHGQWRDGARCRGGGLLHRRGQHPYVCWFRHHDPTGQLESAQIVRQGGDSVSRHAS